MERPETNLPTDPWTSAPFVVPAGSAAPLDSALPARIDRFEVRGELGSGGMGRVLSAWDPALRRSVALKILRDPGGASAAAAARFVAEAQLTSQLEHPSIVPVYETGCTDRGLLYFVMRQVRGRSLRDLLDAQRAGADGSAWPLRRRVARFARVCEAVAYAHDRGVIHRDLKPSNIMLGPFGEVLVMDWGLARLAAWTRSHDHLDHSDPDGGRRRAGIVGTPGYMSPEQASGQHPLVDERSDVWSLGAILYELLCLERPHPPGLERAFGAGVFWPPPEHPAQRRRGADVPDALADAALAALAGRRSERTVSVGRLRQAVEAWLAGSPAGGRVDACLAEARAAWRVHRQHAGERAELRARESTLVVQAPGWAPLDHPVKAELLSVRDRLADVDEAAEVAFERAVAAAERARSIDPDHTTARSLLAEAWWTRSVDAERRGDRVATARFRQRVLDAGAPDWSARLTEDGTVSVSTLPAGAEVLCQRVVQRGLLWTEQEARRIGRTPLVRAPLAPGSYRLTLRLEGRPDVVVPVVVERGRHGGEGTAIAIPGRRDPDFVYVPAGTFLRGGDPSAGFAEPRQVDHLPGFWIARFPVTVGAYLLWLNTLPEDEAHARAPRTGGEDGTSAGRLVRFEPGRGWAMPGVDAQGDAWQVDWPVFGVSHGDASAFAADHGARLPTEREWEKAARGADGRRHPWGDTFDPACCWMQESAPADVAPAPIGSRPLDTSPFGVRDLAGGIRDWCAGPGPGGAEGTHPVRGGCWSGAERLARATHRFALPAAATRTWLGFRLAADLDPPG